MVKHVPWSDLHQDLLELIFNCLKNPIDILRCGIVCRSWQPVALKLYRFYFPLCLLQNSETELLFSLSSQELRKINLPEAIRRRRVCCCSNNGWLLTIDEDNISFPDRFYLINIFSRKEILLPPIRRGLFGKNWRDDLVWRLFLSKSPADSDCIIMVLLKNSYINGHTNIFCCQAGDQSWAPDWFISGGKVGVPFKHNNNLYVHVSGELFVPRQHVIKIDFPRGPELFTKVQITYGLSFTDTFLLNSLDGNDILFVGYRASDPDGKFFDIFSLDSLDVSLGEFREIYGLDGCALFLNSAHENHMLLPAKSTTWFKADCIYFYRDRKLDYLFYDIKTRHSESVPLQVLPWGCWRHSWIYPNE